jgi:UDP-MurNAc hydroxylase
MRVTYYGQACILIEASGKKILTDPWLTEGAYFGTWYHTHILADAGITPETFPKDVDCIFLSHEHQDHVDSETLRHFSHSTPILICRFVTRKFRRYLESLGFKKIIEVPSGQVITMAKDLKVTVLGSVEYTNDAALLIEGENCRVFNETDCKLSYSDLQAIGRHRIDIGFYMFSGANWYPTQYDYADDVQRELVSRRRHSLLRSFGQRVKITKPKIAVPAAGPCTLLDPDRLWLNSKERGIFIDPEEAVKSLTEANLPVQAVSMAASDVWDSRKGFEFRAPQAFRTPREKYIREASERMRREIEARRSAEPDATAELPKLFVSHFNELISAQTSLVRHRINAKVAFVVGGRHGGSWTLDFLSSGPDYVYEGLSPDWTYKIEVEDKLLMPFLTKELVFFEDLLLSLRVRCARRPDHYNEALYHFLYEPDPEKMHNWYVKD